MNEIGVDVVMMKEEREGMKRVLDSIRDDAQKLYELMDGLGAAWGGSAGDRFTREFQAKKGMLDLKIAAFSEILEEMAMAEAIYRDNESSIDQTISSITI